MALVGDPELLFLDEPTTGFDPAARREAWEVIAGLRELGKTILLTTHYMEEAQRLADRVAIVKDGVIVAEGTPDALAGARAGRAVIAFAPVRRAAARCRPRRAPAPRGDGRAAHRPASSRTSRSSPAGRASAASTCPGLDGHRPDARGRLPGADVVSLVLHQYRYDQRQFWREPASVFFTVVLPLIFLVLFVAIFGNEDDRVVNGSLINGSTYYVPVDPHAGADQRDVREPRRSGSRSSASAATSSGCGRRRCRPGW